LDPTARSIHSSDDCSGLAARDAAFIDRVNLVSLRTTPENQWRLARSWALPRRLNPTAILELQYKLLFRSMHPTTYVHH
jgi:hypothetical protein